MSKIRRAIISVSDKEGISNFAKGLREYDIEILSTGGTAKRLRDGGIEVTEISEFTGSPEILGGRVKTLHPKIHGGVLALRGDATHEAQMKENGIEPIDMVIVNLYPFEEVIKKEDVELSEAIENIDIGGPTLLRAAAKNYEYVTLVTDPEDYKDLLKELKKNKGGITPETNFRLAVKAFSYVARYGYDNDAPGKEDEAPVRRKPPSGGLFLRSARDKRAVHIQLGPDTGKRAFAEQHIRYRRCPRSR
jgi:phosphoribosylaminoimidazolecarboxamide formyltransferase/IMP cyclohydrolase